MKINKSAAMREMMMQGKSTKEIVAALNVKTRDVYNARYKLKQKIGATTKRLPKPAPLPTMADLSLWDKIKLLFK